jgi:hypothetical protein
MRLRLFSKYSSGALSKHCVRQQPAKQKGDEPQLTEGITDSVKLLKTFVAIIDQI